MTVAANQYGYWSTGNFANDFRGPAQQAPISQDRSIGREGYGYQFYAPGTWGRDGWNKWAFNASCLRADWSSPIEPPWPIINNNNTDVLYHGDGVYYVTKNAGSAAYDAGAVSTVGVTGDFVLRLKELTYTSANAYGGGVNTDPTSADDLTSIDRTWMYVVSSGFWGIYEGGTGILANVFAGGGANYAWIWRTGTSLNYGHGSTLAAAQAAPDRTVTDSSTFYFDSTLWSIGDQLEVYFYAPPANMTYNVSILATVTPAPSLVRAVAKPVLATSTPSPSLVRQTGKPVQTTSTPAPSLSRQAGKLVRTTSTPAPSLSRQTGKLVLAGSTPAPSLSRQPGKLVLAASAPVPTLSRSVGKLVLTASTPVPSLLKSSAKALRTVTTPSPSLTRSTGKILRTTSTPVPTLLVSQQYARSLLGSTTPVPSVQKSTGKLVLVASTPAPSLTRSIGKVLLASSIPVPLLSRSIGKTLRVSTASAPSLTKQRIYHLTIQAIAGGSGGMGSVRVAAAFFR